MPTVLAAGTVCRPNRAATRLRFGTVRPRWMSAKPCVQPSVGALQFEQRDMIWAPQISQKIFSRLSGIASHPPAMCPRVHMAT